MRSTGARELALLLVTLLHGCTAHPGGLLEANRRVTSVEKDALQTIILEDCQDCGSYRAQVGD